MSNVFGVMSIQDVSEDYVLDAHYDVIKGTYSMPCLEFRRVVRGNGLPTFWDNREYIFQNFKQFLIRYKERMLLPSDKEEFEEIWQILNDEEVEVLLELIDAGEKLEWDKID
jgi:hypothetical protein